MISRIHQKLGTAGFIISIVALVAALCGGAYAAGGGLSGKQKKEVKAIAKHFAGKRGKNGQNGQNGANGAPGAKGDNGAPGAKGDKGDKGDKGSNGTDGEGVSVSPYSGPECESEEGAEFSNGSGTAYACNGTTGFSGELPAGETETGAWAVGAASEEQAVEGLPIWDQISFPAALPEGEGNAGGGEEVKVVFMETEASPTADCPGTSEEPLAAEGVMCVYQSQGFGIEPGTPFSLEPGASFEPGAGRQGVTLIFVAEEAFGTASGTWAVTARE